MPTNDRSKTQPIDVSIIYTMMRDMRGEVLDSVKDIKRSITDLSGRVAVAQKDVIAMTATMATIAKDAADSRAVRLQTEVAEQERERKVLEERIRIVDERLEEKKHLTVGALNTTGKMMSVAELTFEQREKLEEEENKALWKKRREAAITAIIVWSSVGGVGLVFTFLVWIVRFYLDNR